MEGASKFNGQPGGGGGGGGGVLGQVLDRDAQHRPSTRNATRVKKGGSKLYILPNFDEK